MENFKVGEEVIFKNYRLQLGDRSLDKLEL